MSENANAVPGLRELLRKTSGSQQVKIALFDGVVQRAHPLLNDAHIRQAPLASDWKSDSVADAHATFVASLLVGSPLTAVCSQCTLLSMPVVDRSVTELQLSPSELIARITVAVHHALALRADVLHFSLHFAWEKSRHYEALAQLLAQAARNGVYTVVAAGNSADFASHALSKVPGVIPVAMTNGDNIFDERNTRGHLLSNRGLSAPGIDLLGAELPRAMGRRWGSSFAAALVTGSFALLRSYFSTLPTKRLWSALLRPAGPIRAAQLAPPSLNIDATWRALV